MTSNSTSSALRPPCRASQLRLTRLMARHTCSTVTSGFFFPQPVCLLGYEGHGYQAQTQVPHQGRVVPPLEVAQAQVTLADSESVLHVPAAEGHPNQRFDLGVFWGIGQEKLLLARLVVARPDQ